MIRKTKNIIVKHSEYVTPNMKRITFEGDDLKQLSSEQNGGYVKLMLPSETKSFFNKPKVRSYTIRQFNDRTNEMAVDFAMHEPAGPATNWAINAKVGDEISFMGPGPKKFNGSVDGWFLFAADMSALPAALASIEDLPKSVVGEAFLEVTSKDDIQEVNKPEGLAIHWLIHEDSKKLSTQKLEAIKKIEIPSSPNVFAAGELNTIKGIKEYLLSNSNVKNSNNVYISSYWKLGKTDEEHRRAKAFL